MPATIDNPTKQSVLLWKDNEIFGGSSSNDVDDIPQGYSILEIVVVSTIQLSAIWNYFAFLPNYVDSNANMFSAGWWINQSGNFGSVNSIGSGNQHLFGTAEGTLNTYHEKHITVIRCYGYSLSQDHYISSHSWGLGEIGGNPGHINFKAEMFYPANVPIDSFRLQTTSSTFLSGSRLSVKLIQ